jgi:hypothetical protein
VVIYRPASGQLDISTNEIITFAALVIDAKYASEMSKSGYNLSGDELVQFKAMGITPEYLSGIKSLWLKELDTDKVIQHKAQNITPDFIESSGKMGIGELSTEDIIQMKTFNVDKAYEDGSKPNAERLIQLKAVGGNGNN